MKDGELELVARCAGGFEAQLARELRGLDAHRVRPLNGSVAFFGTQRDAYRACLWSRTATRIQLVLARVPASDADELYQSVASFPWEKHVRNGATIAVRAHGTSETLRNTQFTALKVKDALCDRLREVRGTRPDVDAKNPGFLLQVSLRGTRATLALDLSGESLHRRGYRQEGVQSEAPLKETLAASMLLAAGWDELAAEGGMLADAMCGSGTLAIEAALIAGGVAPGLLRKSWGFSGWVRHDTQLWDELLCEAALAQAESRARVRIEAGDLDAQVIELARANAERAGVADLIDFFVDDAANLARHVRGSKGARGLVVANPPYGMRLLSQDALPQVRAALASALDAVPKNWQAALITPDEGIDSALGRLPVETIACHNGPIEAWVRRYDLSEKPSQLQLVSLAGEQRSVRIADKASEQFAGRLRKVGKESARRARKEGVSCYRVYDADLPDYPVSIDFFQGTGRDDGERFLLLTERPRPRTVDALRAGRHFADAVNIACVLLGVERSHAVEQPWISDANYARTRDSQPAQTACVSEGDCRFEIDLAGAAGLSLPLELRAVRDFVAKHASGVLVANLFASGNAASVRAAAAGAKATVTVDTSRERLDWLQAQLGLNGLTKKHHTCVCAEPRDWLAKEVRAHHVYDLVLCSPPERLAAHGSTRAWDVDKDLPELLRQVERVLAAQGTLLLVLPAGAELPRTTLLAEDVSEQMRCWDFARTREPLRCFLLRHAEA